jgi:hypothetical protein
MPPRAKAMTLAENEKISVLGDTLVLVFQSRFF